MKLHLYLPVPGLFPLSPCPLDPLCCHRWQDDLCFLWLTNIPLCTCYIFVRHLPTNEHKHWFVFYLSYCDSAVVITVIQIALRSVDAIFLGYVPTSRLAGSFVSSVSSFGRKIVLFGCGVRVLQDSLLWCRYTTHNVPPCWEWEA